MENQICLCAYPCDRTLGLGRARSPWQPVLSMCIPVWYDIGLGEGERSLAQILQVVMHLSPFFWGGQGHSMSKVIFGPNLEIWRGVQPRAFKGKKCSSKTQAPAITKCAACLVLNLPSVIGGSGQDHSRSKVILGLNLEMWRHRIVKIQKRYYLVVSGDEASVEHTLSAWSYDTFNRERRCTSANAVRVLLLRLKNKSLIRVPAWASIPS